MRNPSEPLRNKTFSAISKWPMVARTDLAIVSACVILALSVRLWLLPRFDIISVDGTGYADTAMRLLRGDFSGLHRYGFYPVLIAMAHLVVPNVELAGRLVSILMGSLLVIPVYALGITCFNRNVATCASLLVVAWPDLVSFSCEVMTQSSYLFLVTSGLILTWRAFTVHSRIGSLLAGSVLGLAYVTRTEAIILPLLLPLALYMHQRWSPTAPFRLFVQLLATFWAGFLLITLPNLAMIHDVTGTWQLAYKTSSALRDGLMYYLNLPSHELPPELETVGYWDIITRYPGYFVYTIRKNFLATWQLLPAPVWLFAIIGFVASAFTREKLAERVYLLAAFAPFLVIVVFYYVDAGYFLPYLPLTFLWIASGLTTCDLMLLRNFPHPPLQRLLQTAPPSLLIVAIIAISQPFLPSRQPQQPIPTDANINVLDGRMVQKDLGIVVKRLIPPGKLMTSWARTGFYAEREWISIPDRGTLDDLLQTARTHKVQFLLVDEMASLRCPLVAPLFKPAEEIKYIPLPTEPQIKYLEYLNIHVHPGFQLYCLYRDQRQITAAVYRILPEGQ